MPAETDVSVVLYTRLGSDRSQFGEIARGTTAADGSLILRITMPDASKSATNDFGVPIPCVRLAAFAGPSGARAWTGFRYNH